MSDSQALRDLQADMQELYDAAKLENNAPLQEKLAKSVAALTKQIKEQEIHERGVIKRDEAIQMAQIVGARLAKRAKELLGDSVLPVLAEVSAECELFAEELLA